MLAIYENVASRANAVLDLEVSQMTGGRLALWAKPQGGRVFQTSCLHNPLLWVTATYQTRVRD